jgi:hypothetical protein
MWLLDTRISPHVGAFAIMLTKQMPPYDVNLNAVLEEDVVCAVQKVYVGCVQAAIM